jgi:2,3-dihydroxybiphenyl 1,2-dioxygenase
MTYSNLLREVAIMAGVSQLGYLGLGISNAKAWHDLVASIIGMQVVPGDDKATSYLRMDEYHHRVELHSNGSDDLEFVGWEVPDLVTLRRVVEQLEGGGVTVTRGTPDEADHRGVVDLFKCDDPNGIGTEIFYGRPINQQPFHPARPMSGFKTGDMGLGHILLYAHSLAETLRFYCDLLGFRVSDFTEVRAPGGIVRLAFLHCNPRHHSVAFLEAPVAPKRINHVMFECNSLDDVGTGHDLCLQLGVPIAIDLGRHMNDHMVSFYMASPSDFALEYGWDGRTIDVDAWQIEHYTAVDSLWGHPQLRNLARGMAPGHK